jgi:uncharacterized membrane protein HdeD (DUF308 family)
MAALGVVAIVFPMASTLATTLFVGWLLLFSGVIALIGSFSMHGTGPFFGALLLSLVSIGVGVFLLFNPLSGAIALTLTLGVIFMLQGSFELFFAFELRPNSGWVAMLISAIASVVLAVIILGGWPGISQIALGTLVGVNFLTTGVGYLMISRALRPKS